MTRPRAHVRAQPSRTAGYSRNIESGHQLLFVILLGLGLIIVSASLSSAQEIEEDPFAGIEEMVVIGSSFAGGLLNTQGDSVTAFDSIKLDAIGVSDVSDLASFTPNLSIVTAGSMSPTFFIRGVGLNDFAVTSTGAIAIFQDRVPRNSSAIQLGKIWDVEGVIVKRGPQGSGAYRNASGGAITIVPRKPSGEFGGYVDLSYGRFNFIEIEGAFEAPIVDDRLSVRIAFAFDDRDGYVTNRCAGAPPIAARVVRTGPFETDPRWSVCGESVQSGTVSTIPENLPKKINRESGWNVRGIFSLTPDVARDMNWFLTVQAGKVDDDSALGQSIGTEGLSNISPEGVELTQGLGGFDANGYRDVDVQDRLLALGSFYRDLCGAACLPPTPRQERLANIRAVSLQAGTALAKELVSLDDEPWNGAYNRVGATENDTFGISLDGSVQITDAVELGTVTGYDAWDRLVDIDLDFTPNTAFQLITADEGFQIYQELRLSGQGEARIPFTWEIGAVVLYEDLRVNVINDFGAVSFAAVGERRYDQQTLGGAVYAQTSLDISETLTIEAGFRYNVEQKQIDYSLLRTGLTLKSKGNEVWDAPTGSVQLTYSPSEDASFYAKFVNGWKSGNYNATGSLNRGVTVANPEAVVSYEIGTSLAFFEDRVRLTGALFFYDYDDYQIFTSDNNFGSNPEFITINASSAENYGAEIELDVSPWEGGNILTAFGWLESQFLDFTQQQTKQGQLDGESFSQITDINYSGNRLLNSPQFTVSILASQRLDLGRFGSLTLRYNGAWTDDFFFDPSEGRGIPNGDENPILPELAIGQEAYWLHGVGVDWSTVDGRIKVLTWVRNLENTAYKQLALDANTFQSTTLYFVGEPRTYGATLSFEF